jgi:arabinose-5-phosphate isomerase
MSGVGAGRTIETARRVLEIEAASVAALSGRLGEGFVRAVEAILSVTGKVVVSGMGKSGIICQKIASTLASTGTPAFFLHPAEGVHGDLGMLMRNDILLAVSNSGETGELTRIIPVVKRMGIKLIAMTGNMDSTLARHGDIALDVGVKEEACPLGLAPTASTTACLAMGDALAVALLERKGFRAEDFAFLHPGGAIGKRLVKVDSLMRAGDRMPVVRSGARMKDAIAEMTAKRMGLTGVFRGTDLVGVITDGDLRRAISGGGEILERSIEDVMSGDPKMISSEALAEAALRMMEEHSITAIFVRDEAIGRVVGVVHMHDLLKAGVV